MDVHWRATDQISNTVIIIIYRSCICKFACMLKFIHNPQINTQDIFPVTHRHVQGGEKFDLPQMHVPS